MFALLYRSAEVFHMTQFSHITNRWLPLYLANDTDANTNTNTNTNENNKILEQYLANHVNEMWKKYL
jgi:hypothetical protein